MWKNKPKNINDYSGFVYLITNKTNGKKYIGKKKYWFKKRLKPLKGKKRRRIEYVESDWKTYYGSCNDLKADISKLGKNNFSREILKSYKYEWECTYHEARLQFENNVLFDDNYYNGQIRVRLGKCKIKELTK